MHKIEVQFSQNLARFAVSLFTREWIEIAPHFWMVLYGMVSLFTREWIEIAATLRAAYFSRSLPLYEGVD